MKLAIVNGSPRGRSSNSSILIEQFLKGYNSVKDQIPEIYYLAHRKPRTEIAELLKSADAIIVILPLYTDSMPAIVKEFIETVAINNTLNGKKVGFIIQSGFPEAHHSTFLEKYFNKLSERLHFNYLGTVIRGGVEGIRMMPKSMTQKLFSKFTELGKYFATHGIFPTDLVSELRKPYKMSKFKIIMFKLISKTGLTNFYWNGNLKKYGAYKNRYNRPFIEKSNHPYLRTSK